MVEAVALEDDADTLEAIVAALEDKVDALEDGAISPEDEAAALEGGADTLEDEADAPEDEEDARKVGILLSTSTWYRPEGGEGGVGPRMLSELLTAAAPAHSTSNFTYLMTHVSSSSRPFLLVVVALKRADCWFLFSFAFSDITNCSRVL